MCGLIGKTLTFSREIKGQVVKAKLYTKGNQRKGDKNICTGKLGID